MVWGGDEFSTERAQFTAHLKTCAKCQDAVERQHHLSDEGGGNLIGLCSEGLRLWSKALGKSSRRAARRGRRRPADGY